LRAKKAAEDELARMKGEVAELAQKKQALEREAEAQVSCGRCNAISFTFQGNSTATREG
jgi:hypothetical protein